MEIDVNNTYVYVFIFFKDIFYSVIVIAPERDSSRWRQVWHHGGGQSRYLVSIKAFPYS